jgi:flagellar protein FliO/FliZ
MTFKKYFFFVLIISTVINNPLFSQAMNNAPAPVQEQDLKIEDQAENTAAADQALPENDRTLGVFTFWDFARMVLILVFVIICIYGLFFLLKKAGSQKFEENDIINILSSKGLTANKSLHVVEIGNQIVVIGASDDALTLITEITDKETIDRIRLNKGETRKPSENSFYNYLIGTFMKGKKQGDFSSEFLKNQKERIKKM